MAGVNFLMRNYNLKLLTEHYVEDVDSQLTIKVFLCIAK